MESPQNDGGEMQEDVEVPLPEHWTDRPAGLRFTAWLAINQVRQLREMWGDELFWQWVREQLGDNFARWWRKYAGYIEAE